MSIESKKCYLVVCEIPYEPHQFKNAAVFLTREAAQQHIDNYVDLVAKEEWQNQPNEIIELPLLEL